MTPTSPAFDSFGLSPELLKAVAALGFETPTPVQAKVIPLLIKGERDLVALAQTGTGKTAAYGLPLLQLTDAKNAGTQALVLCPTRELCLQISKDLADFARFSPHLRILAAYGGASIGEQIRALHRGVHVLVATPGRMNDLLRRGSAQLAGVRRVVLDEADEMLNMGFQEDLETILQEVPDTARTLLFSATMPRRVATLAGKYMQDPEEIIIGRRNAGAANVAHECYIVHARDRYHALKRIIDAQPGFYGIVFCRTRVETQEIASQLMADGYNAGALHGDLTQDQRDQVMKRFRKRNPLILVATDVAARGLDVDDLTHVINYDLPDDLDVYTHRSGRTGRAGKSGVSIVLVHMRETYKIRAIERIVSKRFEQKSVPTPRQICEAQIAKLLDGIKRIDLADVAQLDPYLPKINELLADMPREELIKRFVLGDIKRFIEYYRDAPDLGADAGHARHGERPEHHRRPEAGGHRPHPGPGPAGEREPFSGPVVRLRLNIGAMNGLTVPVLIGLINRATPGPMLKLGRIRIAEQYSLFEVAGAGRDILLPNLNKGRFDNRPLRCIVDHGEGQAPGPHRHHGRPDTNRR